VGLQARPYGIVAAITPWNAPLASATKKLGPALRAGNVVILKPSPHTPLATLRAGELLRPHLPPGVLAVIAGGDALGAALCAHPDVAMVSLTGSTPTGRAVIAARPGRPAVLELGGNDAAIVLGDVDPARIAGPLIRRAFGNAGQACVAIKRLFVHEDRFDELVDALVQEARALVVGPGDQPESTMGPLTTRSQLDRVSELVEEARRGGARVACGGERLARRGWFYAPTVVTGARDDLRLVEEEQFGPALPILRFRRVEEAVSRANHTPYGLGGSVWTEDPTRAAAVARQLECGVVWWNDHGSVALDAPSSGWKASGQGAEGGLEGLLAYTRPQAAYLPEAARLEAEARADTVPLVYGLVELERTEQASLEELREKLRAVLAAGVGLEERLPHRTLLMWAASFGCPGLVRVLLDEGAAADAALDDGLSALAFAAHHSPGRGIVELLLQAGAHPDPLALEAAAWSGDVAAVQAMLEAGAAVDVGTLFTPLSAAARAGHVEVVERLLAAGADRSRADSFGQTPAELAEAGGHHAVLAALRGRR
jgi:acyl-CoA reductase-like NAD-dependent aldehyde dehydrogenase